MKSKRFWAAMLAGMMAVGSLTGCGGGSSDGGSAETTAAASQAAHHLMLHRQPERM